MITSNCIGYQTYHLRWSILWLQVRAQSNSIERALNNDSLPSLCDSNCRTWINIFITKIYHSIYKTLIYFSYFFQQDMVCLKTINFDNWIWEVKPKADSMDKEKGEWISWVMQCRKGTKNHSKCQIILKILPKMTLVFVHNSWSQNNIN